MGILHIILPILIGALIGYCTNYIAIKMLFLPRKEIHIGNFKLPFTPGVIPKNKSRIASAVGNAVSEKLLTEKDIAETVKNSNIKENVVSKIKEVIDDDTTSINTLIKSSDTNIDIEKVTDSVSQVLGGKILDGIKKINISTIISDIVGETFSDLLSNPMVSMFLGRDMVNSICEKMGNAIIEYLDKNGQEIVVPMVKGEVEAMLSQSVKNNLNSLNVSEAMVCDVVGNVIDNFVEKNIANLTRELNIKAIVEQKINEMDEKELEDLILSIMKNELQAVVNLGAVIGAVIGILNIFI
jgi:uncharacterized membrane protein YheB (UPF0754 family)